MELLNELKIYIRTLDKVKEVCLREALDNDNSYADTNAGQYIAYATCQDCLIELVMKYEEGENSA